MPKRYAIYLTGETPVERLGTVTAPDRPTAIKKATELYNVPEVQLEVVLITPPRLKRLQ